MAYWSALLSIVKMITTGTTSFCDMSIYPEDVAHAAEDSGMRSWIGEIISEKKPSPRELQAAKDSVDRLFQQYVNHPLITVTVTPHSVTSCSPDLLVELKSIAQSHKALYSIHLAETAEEVKTCEERYANSPVKHLESLGLLDESVIAQNAAVLSDEDIDLLNEHGVKVSHCPSSSVRGARQVPPIPALLSRNVTLGMGTDDYGRAHSVDLFAEMDFAAKLHKVHSLDPTVVSAQQTLYMATMGGAQVLGVPGQIGSLEPGKKADIIVLDFDQPHLTPVYNIASHLVYATLGTDVIYSIINGKVVMRDRQLTTIDVSEIQSKVCEIAEL
jgi:5-methylthioadenosine/S-adenosylhomocysteine deaminase